MARGWLLWLGSRMASRADHHERALQRRDHVGLGDAVGGDEEVVGLAGREGGLGEALAGAGDHEVLVGDAEALLPALVEAGRAEVGGPEVVGVHAGGDVDALGHGRVEGGQRLGHGEGAAGGDDVLDVHRRAGVAGELEDLGERVGVGARLDVVAVAAVDEHRDARPRPPPRRGAGAPRTRRPGVYSGSRSTPIQPSASWARASSANWSSWRARRRLAGAEAEQGAAAPRRRRRRRRSGPGSRRSVQRPKKSAASKLSPCMPRLVVTPSAILYQIAVLVGLVAQDVDEPRGHDPAGGVDGAGAGERLDGDGGDAVAVDADVGDAVVAGLGVDDPAPGDDDVEGVAGGGRGVGPVERRRVERRRRGRGGATGAGELPGERVHLGDAAEGHAGDGAEPEREQHATPGR